MGGYLGDFTYQAHQDFYPEYCDLEIDTYAHAGMTRSRFMAILASLPPRDQAKVLRGVIDRFPVGSGPFTRTEKLRDELLALAHQLENGTTVAAASLAITSDVVARALADAEQLLKTTGPTSAVDRVHTALHGYLIAVCDSAGISYPPEPSMTTLFKLLRQSHPSLQLGPRSYDIEKVLNASASILDAMNPVRNKASVAHPNATLLADDEARLVINTTRTLLAYLDAKLSASIRCD